MDMLKYIFIIITLLMSVSTTAQNSILWDDTQSKDWPKACRKINIRSSLDSTWQPCRYYATTSDEPKPLIVSLHTWSGDVDQQDTLSWAAVRKNWNYIHPNFRGPNNTPEACGSKFAIQDIEDAISYALRHANVDTSQIHIIGTSGGGYATLLMYMKTKHPVKSFTAWVPIANLEDWYYESLGRKNKYARHIALVTTGMDMPNNPDSLHIDVNEARKRSPYFMPTPVEERMQSMLRIYTGIHDGYRGSVPITQSLNMYNKLVLDYDSTALEQTISTHDMLTLLERRNFPSDSNNYIADRLIHYQKKYDNLLMITIFEGNHEMLRSAAIKQLGME